MRNPSGVPGNTTIKTEERKTGTVTTHRGGKQWTPERYGGPNLMNDKELPRCKKGRNFERCNTWETDLPQRGGAGTDGRTDQ